MGRNAKPVSLHLAAGNPNRLTREQIKARQEGEIKLGKAELDKLKPPAFVKNDPIAFTHWKQCMKEYKAAAAQDIELISSSDVGLLAMYCKTYSEYERLQKSYQTIDKVAYDSEDLDEYIEESEDFNMKVKKQLRSMIAVDGLLRIETAINKKMDMLLKMQDRLFLNPLSKVKNVPKPKAKEEKPSRFGKFGNRSG
ncbi:P27 family phage terminase small subunit [Paenibacillus barcinonensis]|uniref:Phage terminase small subunit n=1 Tax=Paenibacillus barcinonensis TaxID=198119 RepID=A0A2V4VFF8_PAEBA|nr:P27 family phage terminase small subunit [Paenibacillus barcinonensis]PYE52506.1 phage terminase small subunit [Paenibacillus barcinonensis]QKS59335.1 P27 family phage terminase small subunit [Paenibacillus barcinonensis]